jgi:hypothetical protein
MSAPRVECSVSHAHVILRDGAGAEHDLGHGDIVGRLATAALPLDDGRVSEAHAMVSLRDGQLQLVALRGGLAVDGNAVSRVVLAPGQRLELAMGVGLVVVEVWLPGAVMGVEGPGIPRQILPGVASLVPGPRLVRGWRDGASVFLWTRGDDEWIARVGEQPPRPAAVGDRFLVGEHEVALVEVPLADAGRSATRQRPDAPLRIVAHWDTVHLHRDGHPTVVFGGKPARLISELVACESPVGWAALAEALWPDDGEDPLVLRSRFDVLLSRIRRKLRASGVRGDLVRTDGVGTVGLVLGSQDRVEDRS